METGDIIIATLREPREQIWGLLIRLDGAGIVIRGIDTRNFEEWSRQVASDREQALGPATAFYPAHRIERVNLDEAVGAVPSMCDRFHDITNMDAADALKGIPEEAH